MDAIEQIMKDHGENDSSNNRQSGYGSQNGKNRMEQFMGTGEKTVKNAQYEGVIITENEQERVKRLSNPAIINTDSKPGHTLEQSNSQQIYTPFKGQNSIEPPRLMQQNSEMVATGNSGIKVSYILSASKNIKVNADQNVNIRELIANKDRNNKAPYFHLQYEQSQMSRPRVNSYENHADDGLLSDDAVHLHSRQNMVTGNRAIINKSLVAPSKIVNMDHMEKFAQQMYQTQDNQLHQMQLNVNEHQQAQS